MSHEVLIALVVVVSVIGGPAVVELLHNLK